MKILDKLKDKLEDLKYDMPDWVMFLLKVSVISIVWILLLS